MFQRLTRTFGFNGVVTVSQNQMNSQCQHYKLQFRQLFATPFGRWGNLNPILSHKRIGTKWTRNRGLQEFKSNTRSRSIPIWSKDFMELRDSDINQLDEIHKSKETRQLHQALGMFEQSNDINEWCVHKDTNAIWESKENWYTAIHFHIVVRVPCRDQSKPVKQSYLQQLKSLRGLPAGFSKTSKLISYQEVLRQANLRSPRDFVALRRILLLPD